MAKKKPDKATDKADKKTKPKTVKGKSKGKGGKGKIPPAPPPKTEIVKVERYSGFRFFVGTPKEY